MTNSLIHFIATGGTIDSQYDGALDMVVPRSESIVPRYIAGTKLGTDTRYTEVCVKDSRTLTNDDRAELAAVIDDSGASKVVVTHGLYTIPETVRYLAPRLAKSNKTIVLTGSLVPIEGFAMSDGGFSLGYAVAEVRRLDPGVYVCVNGATIPSDAIDSYDPQAKSDSIFTTD